MEIVQRTIHSGEQPLQCAERGSVTASLKAGNALLGHTGACAQLRCCQTTLSAQSAHCRPYTHSVARRRLGHLSDKLGIGQRPNRVPRHIGGVTIAVALTRRNRHMNVPTLLDRGFLPMGALPRWEQAINWEAKYITVPKPDDQRMAWRIVGNGDERFIVTVAH